MGGVEEHAEGPEKTEAGDDEPDEGGAEMGGALDDVGRDEGVGIAAGEHEEHEDAELPDARIDEAPRPMESP